MKKIYVGGGFSPQIIPLFDQFLHEGNRKIFTNENLSPYYRYEFNHFNIRLLKIISYPLLFPIFCLFFIPLTLRKNSWKDKGINKHLIHAYIDACNVRIRNNDFNKSIILKFNVLREIFNAILLSFYVRYYLGVKICLMGHNVYGWRVFNAVSKRLGSKIILYANWDFHEFSFKIDNAWWDVKTDHLNIKNHNEDSENYFKKRLKGEGVYDDSNEMIKLAGETKIDLPKNVIFLHIFKDSPFNVLDEKRLFKDYFEWIEVTVKIILKSKEKWAIRTHPSADRWGEDNEKILKIILDKYDNPKNIVVEHPKMRTAFEIFNSKSRIVTFNGTIHIEALSFGKTPIVISECMGSRYAPKHVIKPACLKDYSDYLLHDLDTFTKKFSHNDSHIIGRNLLYYRECFSNMKPLLGIPYLYRGDSEELVRKAYVDSCDKTDAIRKYVFPTLVKLGL